LTTPCTTIPGSTDIPTSNTQKGRVAALARAALRQHRSAIAQPPGDPLLHRHRGDPAALSERSSWRRCSFSVVVIVQRVVNVFVTYVSQQVAWIATNGLRIDLTRHVLALDMSFHNAHTPGELLQRIDGDVDRLANFFSQFLLQIISGALLTIGVLVLLSAGGLAHRCAAGRLRRRLSGRSHLGSAMGCAGVAQGAGVQRRTERLCGRASRRRA
jgi:hypothetical protein